MGVCSYCQTSLVQGPSDILGCVSLVGFCLGFAPE